MCNGTWVCFDCRLAVRRPTWRHVTAARPWLVGSVDVGRVGCARCRQRCAFLGPAIEIPPRRDLVGWRKLQAWVRRHRLEAQRQRRVDAVRRRHELERRIAALRSRGPSGGRSELIRFLTQQLAAID